MLKARISPGSLICGSGRCCAAPGCTYLAADGPSRGLVLKLDQTSKTATLGSLTNGQRAVIVLRVFDDLTEAQTAQVLGCALGTVKSTMSQALTRLRADRGLAGLPEREKQ